MTVFTIDVSNHDNDRRSGSPLNWAQIRAAGITVACAKATEGDPAGYWYSDPYFGQNATGAHAAGLLSGGYHVLTAGDQASINRQVAGFQGALAAVGANWAMIDVEPFAELEARRLAPTMADVARFAARWVAVDPRPLAVYLPRWYWSALGSPSLTGLPGPLVASDYGPNAGGAYLGLYGQRNGDQGAGWTPYGGVTPALWQYGSQATVPGASSTTDVNAYRGTLAQLTSLLSGASMDVNLAQPDKSWTYNASSAIGNALQGYETAQVQDGAGKTGTMQLGLVTTLKQTAAAATRIEAALAALAQAVGVHPDELAAIQAAAQAGAAAAFMADLDQLAAAIAAKVPGANHADVVAAVREVFASAGIPR